MSRPSKVTPALMDEICDRLSKGEPMAQICRDDHMPDRATVWRWAEADDAFSQRIAHAREAGFDAIADDCLRIADDEEGDPQRDKLRVDTRLKLLAKWSPKKYGDKVDVAHSGQMSWVIETGVPRA